MRSQFSRDHVVGASDLPFHALTPVALLEHLEDTAAAGPVERHTLQIAHIVHVPFVRRRFTTGVDITHRPLFEFFLWHIVAEQDVDLSVARVFLNLSEEFRDSVFRSFENLQEGAGMIDEHAGNILF